MSLAETQTVTATLTLDLSLIWKTNSTSTLGQSETQSCTLAASVTPIGTEGLLTFCKPVISYAKWLLRTQTVIHFVPKMNKKLIHWILLW